MFPYSHFFMPAITTLGPIPRPAATTISFQARTLPKFGGLEDWLASCIGDEKAEIVLGTVAQPDTYVSAAKKMGKKLSKGVAIAVSPGSVPITLIRPPEILSPAWLAKRLQDRLDTVPLETIEGILDEVAEADRPLAAKILARLTQFSSMESMNGLVSSLYQHTGAQISIYSPGKGTLADTLQYLDHHKFAFASSYSNASGLRYSPSLSTWGSSGYYGHASGKAVLLDTLTLKRLAASPEMVHQVLNGKISLLVPEGWQTGSNPFSPVSMQVLSTTLKNVLKDVKTRQAELDKKPENRESLPELVQVPPKKGGISGWFSKHVAKPLGKTTRYITFQKPHVPTEDELIGEALNRPVTEQLEKLHPQLVRQVRIVRNPEAISQPSAATIAEQMQPRGISGCDLKALVAGMSPGEAQATLELFDRAAQIYTPRKLNDLCRTLHGRIREFAQKRGFTEDQVYYIISKPQKSFEAITMIYQVANPVTPDHVITSPRELPDPGRSLVVVLDDFAGSGASSLDAYEKLINAGVGRIVIAPLVATRKAKNNFRLIKYSVNKPFTEKCTFLPGEIIDSFRETPYYGNLKYSHKKLIDKAAGNYGFANSGTGLIFPYMAPDNNIKALRGLAKLITLNGAGVKKSDGSTDYP